MVRVWDAQAQRESRGSGARNQVSVDALDQSKMMQGFLPCISSQTIVGNQILNIAGYRFVDIPDRDELREPFMNRCNSLELKGTILLSPNGINFFLAGSEASVSEFIR